MHLLYAFFLQHLVTFSLLSLNTPQQHVLKRLVSVMYLKCKKKLLEFNYSFVLKPVAGAGSGVQVASPSNFLTFDNVLK